MKKISRQFYFIQAVIFITAMSVNAQSSSKLIHEGNKLYEQKKYSDAEIDYRKSLELKDNSFISNYNLGNAYYQQGKYDEAKQQFETAASQKSLTSEQVSKTYHNLGNTLLQNKKYEESVNAYKQALKANPADNDTRYNLAYAQAMLQQQQQQQKKDGKDNKDNKDNKDKGDKNKQEQNKQKDDKNKQDQKNQEQKEEQGKEDQQQVRKDKISKEDAEKILQALNNDEKKTQKKLNVKQPVKVQIEKEW